MNPPLKPTDEERQAVWLMSAAGIPQERIRMAIRGGIDLKTLEKHFRKELDLACDEVTKQAQGQLVRAINRGESWAICFWMKCRARWRETSVQEFTGPNGTALIPTQVEVVLVPAAKQIVEATAERIESGNGHA